MTALRLVSTAPSPRPFETFYFSRVGNRYAAWAAKGRAATAEGALRAAFNRVLQGRAEEALVHSEAGVVIARVWRSGAGIRAVGSALIFGGGA